jgi:hypothetical protein
MLDQAMLEPKLEQARIFGFIGIVYDLKSVHY